MSFVATGPDDARAGLLLAHGAAAAMDSRFMNDFAAAIAKHGIRTLRFEFGYMAARRTGGGRRPPPKAEGLVGEYRAAVEAAGTARPLFIGGKSMGGRVASMAADELFRERRIAGLICLGYPFHPPGRPDQLRTAHLADLRTPALICQGTRDPFGSRDEVEGYALSRVITLRWIENGDHDFRPSRGGGSGRTARAVLEEAAEAAADWMLAQSPMR